jgi:hypothetical protein
MTSPQAISLDQREYLCWRDLDRVVTALDVENHLKAMGYLIFHSINVGNEWLELYSMGHFDYIPLESLLRIQGLKGKMKYKKL